MSQHNDNHEKRSRVAQLEKEMQLRADSFKESLLKIENDLNNSQLLLIEEKLKIDPDNKELKILQDEIKKLPEVKKLKSEERVLNLFICDEIKEVLQFIKQVKISPFFEILTAEEKEQFDKYYNQLQEELKFFDQNMSHSNVDHFKKLDLDKFFKQKAYFIAENEMLIAGEKEDIIDANYASRGNPKAASFLLAMIAFSGLVSVANGQSNYTQIIDQAKSQLRFKNLQELTSQDFLKMMYGLQNDKYPVISYTEGHKRIEPSLCNDTCFNGYTVMNKDLAVCISTNPQEVGVKYTISNQIQKPAIIKTACSAVYPFEMHAIFTILNNKGLSNIKTLQPIVFQIQKQGSKEKQYTLGASKININTQYDIPYSIENLKNAILLETIGGDTHKDNVLYQDGQIICIDSDAMLGTRTQISERLQFNSSDTNLDDDFKRLKEHLLEVQKFLSEAYFPIFNGFLKERVTTAIQNKINSLDKRKSFLMKKQKKDIKRAQKKALYDQKIEKEEKEEIRNWMIGGVLLILASGIAYFAYNKKKEEGDKKKEEGEKNNSKKNRKDKKKEEPYKKTSLQIMTETIFDRYMLKE